MARRSSRRGTTKRKQTAEQYGFSVPDYDPFGGESELRYYQKLASRADRRLQALEKLSMQDITGFKDILKYAYSTAMYEIRKMRGQERSRFGQSIPRTKSGEINRMELHRRTEAVKRFLESPTSTKTGTLKVYKHRADQLNKSLGLSGADALTWQDIANYYESKFAEKKDSEYGSKTKFRALGAVRRISKNTELLNQIRSGENVKIAKDAVVNEVALNMIRNGLNPSDIF